MYMYLFVSISQVIGCEDRLRNDLYCVEWGVKLYTNQPTNIANKSYLPMRLVRVTRRAQHRTGAESDVYTLAIRMRISSVDS